MKVAQVKFMKKIAQTINKAVSAIKSYYGIFHLLNENNLFSSLIKLGQNVLMKVLIKHKHTWKLVFIAIWKELFAAAIKCKKSCTNNLIFQSLSYERAERRKTFSSLCASCWEIAAKKFFELKKKLFLPRLVFLPTCR